MRTFGSAGAALRLIALAGLLLPGARCAYYNTFYNAKAAFREGVRRVEAADRNGARDQFDKTIKKSAAVIQNYPKSRWVDHALLLIGASYYHLGEYGKALAKFENLQAAFPGSQFLDDARYYQALALIDDRQYARGLQLLREVREESREFRDDADFQLAVTAFKQEDYDGAVQLLSAIERDRPRGRHQEEARRLLAEAYFRLGRYPDAVQAYCVHRKQARLSRDRVLDDLKIAECYLLGNQSDSALAVLGRQSDQFPEHGDRRHLLTGKALLNQGRKQDAYRELSQVRSGGDAAEAFFLIGKSYEQDTNFNAALAYYDSARARDPTSASARQAGQRRQLVSRLAQGLTGIEDTAQAKFMLAEVYHLNLAQDSQALVQYERVADSFPRSEFAPKALYAVAWLKRNSLRSPDSLVAYQEVVKRFPRTVYAQEARKVLGQPLLPEDQIIRPKPRVDTAQARRAADSLAARVRSDSLARIGQLPEGESPKPPIAEREQGRGRDSGAGGTRRERGRERRERGLPGYEPEMRGRPAGPETGEPTTREPMPEEPGQRPEPELPRPEPPGPVPSEPATRELPGKPTPITARDSGAEGTPEPMRPEPEPPVGVPPEVVPPASESAPPAVEAETTATRTAPLDSASAARPPVRLASPARTVSADSALKPVFFDFDRATVRSSDTQALRTALLRLEADSSLGLLVTGYCDPLGAVDYNDALGRRRADAVRRWLIARGVAENRLDVLSFGSEAVTYTDPDLYWYERRCEFRIVK